MRKFIRKMPFINVVGPNRAIEVVFPNTAGALATTWTKTIFLKIDSRKKNIICVSLQILSF